MTAYRKAHDALALIDLEKMLFEKIPKGVSLVNRDGVPALRIDDGSFTNYQPLPTPTEVVEGNIMYSRNMYELIKLQSKLVNEIASYTLNFTKNEVNALTKTILLMGN